MSLLRIHAAPNRTTRGFCRGSCSLPVWTSYFYLAQQRHRENPDDRVMPTATQMIHGIFGCRTEAGGRGRNHR